MSQFDSPTPDQVVALRARVQAALASGITAGQDWCAGAVCTSRRSWQQWERGERAMHAGFFKLACLEVERLAGPVRPANPALLSTSSLQQ
ncbi:hypothetical protein [Malikia spinosa]|uniref:XRE family transcriptional regulator n=1 Tax=Malikia spinosa TaxID=86180 RepID=A0A7C9J6W2_9BURK|nr:hypothetical protein [Malikia spinosa]MYZ52448.1 hypothetical protein [Malikia spinosa]OGB69824.1 MAG: hypothetical protein A2486_04450 [Burkholderiales bacterium RIFOXYC12_FULL_65_23]